MKFSRKLTLCNPKRFTYRKYEIELPPRILQQYEALPKVRMFSWKYDFLKNLLVERLGKFPQLLLWSGNGSQSELIARGFRSCSINWDKAVAYLVLNPVEEYSEEAGILFLTNGVAFCLKYASAEFFPWLEVAAMPLMAHEAEGLPQVEMETPHQSLWRFDISPEQQELFDALAILFDDLRAFCCQAAPQPFKEYLHTYLELNNELLLQLKTDSWEQIEDVVRLHTYYMMLAQDCQMLEVLLPAAQELVNQVLLPRELLIQAQQIIAFYAEHGVSFSGEMVEKTNYLASQQKEQIGEELAEKAITLMAKRKFDQAERQLTAAIQQIDALGIFIVYYLLMLSRKRFCELRRWLDLVPQLPRDSVQRTFLTDRQPFIESLDCRKTLEYIAANEDMDALDKYYDHYDALKMTPLMYAVLYDIPSVVSYYKERFSNKEALYNVRNVLGMRAIELAAMSQTGFEFCKLCAEMAKPDLQKAQQRYLEEVSYAKKNREFAMLLLYEVPHPKEAPNPFATVIDAPTSEQIHYFASACRSIQEDAKELFYAQTLLYALGTYKLDQDTISEILPLPVSGDLFKKLIDEQNILHHIYHEELLKQDPALQKDEFETMDEYAERVANVLEDKTTSRFGSKKQQFAMLFQKAKEESLIGFDPDERLQAFSVRRNLLLRLFGCPYSEGVQKMRLSTYDAELESFSLDSEFPGNINLLDLPRSIAREIAQQYRGAMLSVCWNGIALKIGDDDMVSSSKELADWVLDHEGRFDIWGIDHRLLLERLVQTSGGLISSQWAEKCDEVCYGKTLFQCISGDLGLENEENVEEWQKEEAREWRQKRNFLLLMPMQTNIPDHTNVRVFQHVVPAIFAAMVLVKENIPLTIHPLGNVDFDGERYIVGADPLLNNTEYFPDPDESWLKAK